MTDLTFNLVREPWLPVLYPDGSAAELSLVEVFRQAPNISALTGETPTQAFALHRLLLAVLLRAYPWWDKNEDAWGQAWRGEINLLSSVESYLERHADRFDLLHPQQPFYQVANLQTSGGGTSGLERLVGDLTGESPFFSVRAGAGAQSLSLAEAARWLVHVQGYDTSGIKAGIVGDARTKGGKIYPCGIGWLGELGGVMLEGNTLWETLLLNLVLVDIHERPWGERDLPLWERPPQGPGVEPGHPKPQGLAGLLTWQSRRVRLVHQSQRVTSVVLSYGDPLAPQNMHLWETMTAWRRSEPQEKKHKLPLVYMPRSHQVSRSLWRGLSALLSTHDLTQQPSMLRPALLDTLARRQYEDLVPGDYPVIVRSSGLEYGTQNSLVLSEVSDVLAFHVVLVGQKGTHLRSAALDAVSAADAAVLALANLASDLSQAAGGDRERPREMVREGLYAALDTPFRSWVNTLQEDTDILAARSVWEKKVWGLAANKARHLVDTSGPSAWVGRTVDKGKPTERTHNTALADRNFYRMLSKALPYARPLNPVGDKNHE